MQDKLAFRIKAHCHINIICFFNLFCCWSILLIICSSLSSKLLSHTSQSSLFINTYSSILPSHQGLLKVHVKHKSLPITQSTKSTKHKGLYKPYCQTTSKLVIIIIVFFTSFLSSNCHYHLSYHIRLLSLSYEWLSLSCQVNVCHCQADLNKSH